MVISTIFAPSLLGLIDGYGVFNGIPEKHHCSLFAETDLRGRWIGHQAAVEILNAQNLWQDGPCSGAAADGVEHAFAGDGGGGFLSDGANPANRAGGLPGGVSSPN